MLNSNNITNLVNEESVVELPIYFKSPIYYSLNVATNISIILTNPESHKWFYNCFLQLVLYKNEFKIDIYPANMVETNRYGGSLFRHEDKIDIDGGMCTITPDNLISTITTWLRKNYYVISYIDVSKLKNTRYDKWAESRHSNMVFGFDDDIKAFKMIDYSKKGHLSIIPVKYDSFINAAYSPIIKRREFHLIRLKRNVAYEFDLDLYKTFLNDYINSFDTSKRYAHIMNTYKKYWWGLSVYEHLNDLFKQATLHKHNHLHRLTYYKPLHALYEHKKCLLYSIRYLEENNYLSRSLKSCMDIEKLIGLANQIRMLFLKYSRTRDKDIISSIINTINLLCNEETNALHKIYNALK